MKLSQSEVFEIICKLKPSNFKLPDVNIVTDEIAKILQIKAKQTSTVRSSSSCDVVIDSEDFNIIVDGEVEDETTVASKRNHKDFRSLGKRMQRECTQGLVDAIHQFIENEDGTLTEKEVLGYLLYRMNYVKNKEQPNFGSDLFHNPFQSVNYNVQKAVSIMHSLVLSKEQIRTMKRIMTSKGIYFPNTNEINEARKKLRPVSHSVLDGKGVGVNYCECVENTVSSIFSVLNETGKPIVPDSNITVIFKDGCDGAGQQVTWNSCSMKNAEQNMFQYGIVPLKVLSNDEVVWSSNSPNSPECLRPIYLVREKESNQEMIELVIKTTDAARHDMMNNGIDILYEGKVFHVNIVIKDTMKDLKLKRSISGLGGADCILCVSKTEDWSIEENILNGFNINRSAENNMELYNQLVQDGNITVKQGDFDTRKGLTKKPITSSDQHNITIVHSYINVTTWFLKLLYRMNSEYIVWRESKTRGTYQERKRTGFRNNIREYWVGTGCGLQWRCQGWYVNRW